MGVDDSSKVPDCGVRRTKAGAWRLLRDEKEIVTKFETIIKQTRLFPEPGMSREQAWLYSKWRDYAAAFYFYAATGAPRFKEKKWRKSIKLPGQTNLRFSMSNAREL